MFIDEAEIMVKGGHGGAGKVAFFRNRKGASGGNGGHGGSVFAAVFCPDKETTLVCPVNASQSCAAPLLAFLK